MKVDPQGDRRGTPHGRGREAKSGTRAEPGDEEPVLDAELQEFLEADRGAVPVRTRFREALRERLWRIVRVRTEIRRSHGEREQPEHAEPRRRDVARRRRDD